MCPFFIKMDLNNDFKEKELITKQNILKYVDSYDIISRYLGKHIPLNKIVISPFLRNGKKETKPSFGLFKKGNEIIFNDFAKGGGDFLMLVQKLFNLDFYEALSKICIDFNLEKYYYCKKIENYTKPIKNINVEEKKKLLDKPLYIKKISIKKRNWCIYDKKYWSKYGITLKMLERYNVYPIMYYTIGKYAFQASKFSYAYEEQKDNIKTYKIYQPFNIKYKWINNNDTSVLFGWNNLPETGNNLIITKSMKDLLVIVSTLNIPAIAIQNEKVFIKDNVFDELANRFKNIYFLFDNDYNKDENYGQILANKYLEKFSKYNVQNLVIKSKYKTKDISDFYKKYGKEKTQKLFNI